jgi:hypothetical protein
MKRKLGLLIFQLNIGRVFGPGVSVAREKKKQGSGYSCIVGV